MKSVFATFALILTFSVLAAAQTTAFNYQGRLNDGSNPANGKYDLQFRLYDALTGDNIIGTAITKANTMLVNGVFSTQLDFGADAFNGANRFIEIRLRSAGTENGYVILGPRQQILAVPYTVRSLKATLADDATHAVNADNATNATNATNAMNATNAQTAVNAQQLSGVPASQYVKQGAIGTVKAMAEVDANGQILRCYNSTLTGSEATATPCGITVNHFTGGGYGMNFGFSALNSFVSVALTNQIGFNSPNYRNGMIRYEKKSSGNIDIRTTTPGNDDSTVDYGFTVILF